MFLTLKKGKNKPFGWLPTHSNSNARFHCPILGVDGIGRTSPGSICTMDQGSFRDGSLLRFTTFDGSKYVLHAEIKSRSPGSYASENNAMVADRFYLFLPLVPRRPSPLLALQQLTVYGSTICDK